MSAHDDLEKLRYIEPEACITYYPVEQKWKAHVWGRELSGFCDTREAAIYEALIKSSELIAEDKRRKAGG